MWKKLETTTVEVGTEIELPEDAETVGSVPGPRG